MAAFHDLLRQIYDERLRARLASEWTAATRDRKFGLVFERHLPEVLPMFDAKPRRGDLVCRRHGPLSKLWRVHKITQGTADCVSVGAGDDLETIAVEDLLVVRQFGQPIFPTLTEIDVVSNGAPSAPWHTLIEADNYHALQLLDYLYAGKVDCIYIDLRCSPETGPRRS